LLALPALVPADSGSYVAWGSQLLAQQKYQDAIRYFSAAMTADPRDAAAYRGIGYAYMGLREDSQGLPYMEYSLRLNPTDSGLRAYLARIYQSYGNRYYQGGDKTHALAWWDKALTVDPGNTPLADYVAQVRASAAASNPVAAAPSAKKAGTLSAPGMNPWIMGGTVVVLGAIMIFLF
jgi:tetratricopeptide (TPR) repeat protein